MVSCSWLKKKLKSLNGKDRMWRLEFSIASEHGHHPRCRPGSWCISLYLLESSPPARIDSRLIIPEAMPPSTDQHSDHLISSVSELSSRIQPNRSIELRLKSGNLLEASKGGGRPNRIIVMLQDNLGASLQYG